MAAQKPVQELDRVIIRFAGDSGDGMQLTGDRFTSETAMLGNDNLERGLTPFLHVSHANERAKSLYARNGFRLRRDIGFHSLQRA